GSPLLYLVAVAAGVCVTTALVVLLKGLRNRTPGAPTAGEPDGTGPSAAPAAGTKTPVRA
ncbi:PTS fructose transporter subunit IIBC, partial [Streptomyces sp. TRM76130]|nr:PTS fructose transporter subunit IIBC [Streptomyces sp. TRM76130]